MPTSGGFARRLAAGCVLAVALVLPGPVVLVSETGPASSPVAPAPGSASAAVPYPVASPAAVPAAETPAAESDVLFRGLAPAGPGLRPDPPMNPNSAPDPGRSSKPAPATGTPTQQEWERLLDRLARHGARPITDESGQVVLDSEHLLVLAGGAEGLAALRSWGAEITAEDRPDVYAVRSGGRVVARYLLERGPGGAVGTPAPGASSGTASGTTSGIPPDASSGGPSDAPSDASSDAPTDAPSGTSSKGESGTFEAPSPGASPAPSAAADAPPVLPRTGSDGVDTALVALGGAGIVCAGGLLVLFSRRREDVNEGDERRLGPAD